MMFMPYYFFFFSTLVFGTFMSISSCNWLYVWMGLEINLISFIPLIMSSGVDMETESSLKYFLIQALGSGMLLFGSLVEMNYPNSMIPDWLGVCILVMSLMVKLGMAPFHFWLPHVMGGISWISCLILSVWQKIGPLFVLSSFFFSSSYYVYLSSCLGALIGGVGGMNQSQMRVLLAYSSIGHMGWMCASMMYSFSVFFIYFVVYSLVNIGIMVLMNVVSVKGVSLMSFDGMSFAYSCMIGLLFMSLAGLPPFLGFYPKWMVMGDLMNSGLFFLTFVLILGSLLNIYYYLSVFFNVSLNSFFSGVVYSELCYKDFSFYVGALLVVFSSMALGLIYVFV